MLEIAFTERLLDSAPSVKHGVDDVAHTEAIFDAEGLAIEGQHAGRRNASRHLWERTR